MSRTTTPSEPGRLFREGRLADAVLAANAAVRTAPTDLGARVLLAELLLFAGNLERVDTLLDAGADIDPSAAVVLAEFRQLLRGEVARRQLLTDGRVPEFLGEPTETQRCALAALVALRAGDAPGAAALAGAAEAARVRPSGSMDGRAFDDLRDADDLLAGSFEVLTTTGKYFWVSAERVSLLALHPPRRPRDLYWRRATMEVADGPDGEVYLPATYAAADAQSLSDALRLGRETDWRQEGEAGPVRGVGARTFLLGEDAATLMELTTLRFEGAA